MVWCQGVRDGGGNSSKSPNNVGLDPLELAHRHRLSVTLRLIRSAKSRCRCKADRWLFASVKEVRLCLPGMGG